MSIKEDNHCIVDRNIEQTMIVSRIFGLAPVVFKKDQRNNMRVMHISRFFYIYGILLYAVFCFVYIYAISMGVKEAISSTSEDRTKQSYIVPIFEKSVSLVMIGAAIFWNIRRMKTVMYTMEQMMKIKKKFQVDQNSVKKCYSLELATGFCITLRVIDCWVKGKWEDWLGYVHVPTTLFISLIALQFTDTVLIIQSVFQELNKNLRDVIDQLQLKENSRVEKRIQLAKKLRQMNQSYVNACEVSRRFNSIGNLSFFVLVKFSSNLTITSTNLIKAINFKSGITFILIFTRSFECLWTLLDTVIILSFVEPCYRTKQELKNTRLLLGEVLHMVKSNLDPLIYEAETFLKCILLNEVSYTALDIVTLARPLLLKVIGVVTTVLILIFEIE